MNGLNMNIAEIDLAPQLLQSFFSMLVTSPWAIPISALGVPSAGADVAAAIRAQHGLMVAQALPYLLVPASTTNAILAGWATGPRADVLPRRPTSIASASALLAGGNLADHIAAAAGRRASWRSP